MRTLLLTLVASVVCAQSPQEKAWEVLNTGLTDKRVDRRAKAVRALGLTLRNERATTEAEKALTDPDAEIRAAGCIALGEMKSSASVPKLRDALGDEEAQVGVAATQALDMLGDPSALEAYYAILTGQRRAKGAFVDQQIRGFRDPRRLAKLGFEQG
ncbi:MAG TPA: HEAT repeat domain-containing protein, partial [Bryobacteraceae bacterium]|nr:HEAT repeat domain-containing protein [Bryobacteraceae bacterium]